MSIFAREKKLMEGVSKLSMTEALFNCCWLYLGCQTLKTNRTLGNLEKLRFRGKALFGPIDPRKSPVCQGK